MMESKTKQGIRTLLSFLSFALVLAAFLYFCGGLCPVRLLLGIPCPGCGMTRAVGCVLHGDFSGAFSAHPLWVLLPVFAFLLLRMTFPQMFLHLSRSPRYLHAEERASVILLCAVIFVYVLRLFLGWRG